MEIYHTILVLLCVIHQAHVSAYEICFGDEFYVKSRIREALKIYPEDTYGILCQLTVAYNVPKDKKTEYTNCVNDAREEHIGKLQHLGGLMNPRNLQYLRNGLEQPLFRFKVGKCGLKMFSCYDVRNVRNCMAWHEV